MMVDILHPQSHPLFCTLPMYTNGLYDNSDLDVFFSLPVVSLSLSHCSSQSVVVGEKVHDSDEDDVSSISTSSTLSSDSEIETEIYREMESIRSVVSTTSSERKRKRCDDDDDDDDDSTLSDNDNEEEEEEEDSLRKRSMTCLPATMNVVDSTSSSALSGIDFPSIFASLQQFLNEPPLEPQGHSLQVSFETVGKSLTEIYHAMERHLKQSADLSFHRSGYSYQITCHNSYDQTLSCMLRVTIYRPRNGTVDSNTLRYLIGMEWISGDRFVSDEVYRELQDVLLDRHTNADQDAYGYDFHDMTSLINGTSEILSLCVASEA